MQVDPYGSAMPFICEDVSKFQAHDPGMDIRTYIATATLNRLAEGVNEFPAGRDRVKDIAKMAVMYADALIAELNETAK